MQDGLDPRLVTALFRAATGSGAWDDALAPMAADLGAHHHSLWLRSERDLFPVVGIADTVPMELVEAYKQHYGAMDPLAPLAAARPRGSIFTSDELVPFETLARTSYYNEWMGRNGMRRFIGAACPLPSGDRLIAIAFQRPLDSEPFGARERERMAAFTTQLTAAVEVWDRLRAVEQRIVDLERLLDAVDVGMGIVAADGRMTLHNRPLEVTLSRRDGLGLDADGRLITAVPCGLDRALYVATTTRIASSLDVPRPSGRRSYRVVVAPLDDDPRGAPGGQRSAVVRVHDPDVVDRSLERRLSEQYSLTPAEAEVSVLLARGCSVERIAAITGRSAGTAHNLIKRAFAKTGTHRQAALVALVCALEHERP